MDIGEIYVSLFMVYFYFINVRFYKLGIQHKFILDGTGPEGFVTISVLKMGSNYSFKPYIKQNNIWCIGKISYGPIRTFYRHISFCRTYGKQCMSTHRKRKKNTNSRRRNFSTLQTLQNWCILGNQTIKNHSIISTNFPFLYQF